MVILMKAHFRLKKNPFDAHDHWGRMAEHPIFHVDAFTNVPFKGNPAGVCLLERHIDEEKMQNIASEMNLSETAFVCPVGKDSARNGKYEIRWFTPKVEVPLCGHATLGSSAVLFYEEKIASNELVFSSASGELRVRREGDALCMDFPMNAPRDTETSRDMIDALGLKEVKGMLYSPSTKKLLVHADREKDVRVLAPDFEKMKSAKTKDEVRGVIVTSEASKPYDFVSRYFNPWVGVNEDPVTGAAHTVLAPYWAKLLGKSDMLAFQASHRGGEVRVRLGKNDRSNRVDLIGNAVVVARGKISI